MNRIARPTRHTAIRILLSIMSLVLTVFALEVAYRLYRSITLNRSDTTTFAFVTGEAPLYYFDENLGFRYIPNTVIERRRFDANNQQLLSNPVSINNLGHVSWDDDTIEKAVGVYRIAVIGDSFTASLYNEIPWTDRLQSALNNNEHLKSVLGVSEFDVINFGLDSIGIVQFEAIFEHEVQAYEPDIVLIHLISDDINRKFLWRAPLETDRPSDDYLLTLYCYSRPIRIENRDCGLIDYIAIEPALLNSADLSRIKKQIVDWRIAKMPWFELYPELLSITSLGKRYGLRPGLNLRGDVIDYYDETEGIEKSLSVLRNIAEQHPDILIFHIPLLSEVLNQEILEPASELMNRGNDLNFVSTLNYFPLQNDLTVAQKWYHDFPGDTHFNDQGAEMYAQLVHDRIVDHIVNGAQ